MQPLHCKKPAKHPRNIIFQTNSLIVNLLKTLRFSKTNFVFKYLNFKCIYQQNYNDLDLGFNFVEKKNLLSTKCINFGRAYSRDKYRLR